MAPPVSGAIVPFLVVALSAGGATTAVAQTASGSLTMREAVERAMTGNPTLVAARLRRAVGVAGLAVARERLNPEATIEVTRETPHEAFGLALPLELGGKRAKRVALGEAIVRGGDAELAATIAQVRNDVRRAYVEALVADARLQVLRDLRDLARRARDTAQARFDAGDAPRLEVLQASLALAAADNDATTAEGAGVAARARLNALLGQPLEAVQTLATPLDAGVAVLAAVAVDAARSASAELAVLDRQLVAQRARVAMAQSLRVPDLVSSVAFTRSAQPEFAYGWRVGAGMTVPLFTTHRAGVLVEQAILDQLGAERHATLARITGEVTASAATAEAHRAAYAQYRDAILPQAQQVEQLAQDAYELGQTNIVTLLQALQASRDVRLRSLDAALQHQTALADLERAVGAPLP